MKIDIERYNKSAMPENAEKYFYGPTGIRRTRCDSQSLKLVFEIKSDRLVAVGVVDLDAKKCAFSLFNFL